MSPSLKPCLTLIWAIAYTALQNEARDPKVERLQFLLLSEYFFLLPVLLASCLLASPLSKYLCQTAEAALIVALVVMILVPQGVHLPQFSFP